MVTITEAPVVLPRPALDEFEAVDALYACETPDDVAVLLRRHQIKGKRWKSMSCPIATYLQQECGYERVSVTHRRILAASGQRIQHTPAIKEFILRFDGLGHRYDDLRA